MKELNSDEIKQFIEELEIKDQLIVTKIKKCKSNREWARKVTIAQIILAIISVIIHFSNQAFEFLNPNITNIIENITTYTWGSFTITIPANLITQFRGEQCEAEQEQNLNIIEILKFIRNLLDPQKSHNQPLDQERGKK